MKKITLLIIFLFSILPLSLMAEVVKKDKMKFSVRNAKSLKDSPTIKIAEFRIQDSYLFFNPCSYTLNMIDSYGDGWNGATMDVLVNNVVILDDVTFTSGFSSTLTFSVNDGDDITTVWNGGGVFDEETTYEILDADEIVVGTGDESSIGTGTITANCPTCGAPENIVVSNLNANGATFTWDAMSNATGGYEWMVIYDGLDPTSGPPLETGTTMSNSVVVSNLTASTNYEINVRAICDTETSNWRDQSFLTACDYITDFNENFDAAITPELPVCWTSVVDNGASTYAYVNTYQWNNFSAPNSVEMSNSDSPATANVILVAPIVSNASAGTHWLRFYAMNSSESEDIEVGTITNPEDGTTFTAIETVDITGTWTEHQVDFTGYTGTDEYIAIRRLSTATYSYVYLDNIIWEAVPACVYPTDLVVTSTNTGGVDISWDEVGTGPSNGYEWIVVNEGGDPDTTADVVTSGTSTTANANVSGLNSGTIYEFYVKADCGADGFSSWSLGKRFTTAYGCGDNFYDTGGVAGDYQNDEVQTWTISPDSSDEYVQISFTMVDIESCCDELTVYDGADTTAPILANDLESLGTFTSSVPGGSITVSFTSDGIIAYTGWEATISCVTCIAPPSIDITNLTSSSATINWNSVAGVASYDYVVVNQGDDPEDPNTVAVATGSTSNLSVDISLLSSATNYDVYVMSNCGVDGMSPWSNVTTFLTYCDAVTEFSENFDSVLAPELPVCWSKLLDNGASDWAYVNIYQWNNFSAPNSVEMYNSDSPTGSNIILIAPMVSNLDAGTHWLRFFAFEYFEGSGIEVGTLSDPFDGSTFTPFQVVDISTTWEEYIVNFETYTGTDEFIAFRLPTTSMYTSAFIDNVVWEQVPTCIDPDDLEIIEVTSNSATVTWTGPANATNGYQYIVVPAGGDPTDPAAVLASGSSSTNQVTIEGLESGTEHDVYIIADCGTIDGLSILSDLASFTTLCQPPTGLTISEVGYDQVEVSWDAVPQSLGYEYIVVPDGMPLTEENYIAIGAIGSGSISSVLVEYLSMGNEYDIYLRIVCDTNFYGEWEMADFETLGVDKNTIEGFSFYPNPINDELNLNAMGNIEKVMIYNMLGQIIKSEKPNNIDTTINMSNFQAGAYILKVIVDGQSGTYRIIKK